MIFDLSLVLMFSWLAFSGVRFALSKLGINAPHRTLLRYAQVLVLVSILVPAALHWVPEKTFPIVNAKIMKGYAEEPSFYSNSAAKTPKQILNEATSALKVDEGQNGVIEFFLGLGNSVWLYLWMVGFFIFAVRLAFSFYQLNQVLKRSVSYKHVGSVKVAISEQISVPFSARLFRTQWVVLPLEVLERKSDFSISLKHEFQHHRQLDTLWAVAIEVFQCVFFFNPAIYAWKNTIIELQEFSCDEALTGQRGVSPRDYGSCLVRVAEAALENREVYVGTTCMAAVLKNPKAFKSLLKRRIEMIMNDQKSARKLAGSFIGTLTLMFTIAVAYGAEQSTRETTNANVTVDSEIQKIADRILQKSMKSQGAQAGFAIVSDPHTGRILAVANIDQKHFKKGQWALSEQMEPASLMKGIVVAEAIEQKTTTADEEHNCENGVYQSGGQTFHDWKNTGFEKLTTTKTVAVSSDICALKIAEQLGENKLRQMFVNYGFGTPDSKTRIAPAAAYGMNFKATPIEIIQAYGAIANGGNLLEPQFKAESKDSTKVIRRVLSEQNSKTMRDILHQVILVGTGSRAANADYTLAGKTESSYSGGVISGDSTGGENPTDIAGFVGFAPALDPKVEVYVAIFQPSDKTGAHGSTHALPVFREIAESVLKHMKIAPDNKKI